MKTEGYKGLDCGSRYVWWKEMGFVLEVDYGGREGFLHVTRGVEGFDVQASVVEEVGMSSSRPKKRSRVFLPIRNTPC